MLLEDAPVAAEEAVPRHHVEGARDDVSVPAGLDHLDVLGHAREDALVEGLVEPAAAPHELVDRRAMQGVGFARKLRSAALHLVSTNSPDLDPLLCRSAHLALDRVAVLRAE